MPQVGLRSWTNSRAKAKAKLSELVARAEAGEEVVITRHGKPAVTLTPKSPPQPEDPRKLGIWAHLNLNIPDHVFFEPDPDIEAWIDEPISPKT